MDNLIQRSKVKLIMSCQMRSLKTTLTKWGDSSSRLIQDIVCVLGRRKFKVNTRYCLCFCEHFTRLTGIDSVHCILANGTCCVSFAATSVTQLTHDYHWQEEIAF